MRTTPQRNRVASAGFTLIEVLVALTALSLLSLALVEGLRAAQRLQQRAVETTREQGQVLAAQRWLRRMIESAALDPQAPFSGTHTTLQFRSAGALADRAGARSTIALAIEPAADGSQRLVATWHEGTPTSTATRTHEVILDRLASARWRYRAVPSDAAAGAGLWLDRWSEAAALPPLVRLEVTFRAGDRRQWPDWWVAPRTNVAANCVFDVIAQRCRAAG